MGRRKIERKTPKWKNAQKPKEELEKLTVLRSA